MSKITTAQFAKGMFIDFKSEPHQIVEFQHVNPGKGSAFIRTKLKGVTSGRVQEFTFKSGETVEEVPIFVREMQYLFKTDSELTFMDNSSYEQITMKRDLAGRYTDFMKEGDTYQILMHESGPLGMRFPKKVRLKVTEAEEGVKGNTVSGARKNVILETGVTITAPLFIKTGDVVAVDPDTGTYQERVSQE